MGELSSDQVSTIQKFLVANFSFRKFELTQSLIKNLYKGFSNTTGDIEPYVYLKKEYFKSETTYDFFCERHKEKLVEDKSKFKDNVSRAILQQFLLVQRNQQFTGALSSERQEREENEIKSIHTVKDYIEVVKKKVERGILQPTHQEMEELKSYDEEDYIVDEDVSLDDVFILNNKDSNFNIVPNPILLPKTYKHPDEIIDINNNKRIFKTTIHIKRKISSKNMLITKYRYSCPKCNNPVDYLPYKLLGNDIGCWSCQKDAKGNEVKVSIEKKKYDMLFGMNLYVYEAKLNPSDKESFFVYSRDNDLQNSHYEVEMILDHKRMEYNDGKGKAILFVLSKKEVKPDIDVNELIVEGSGIPFEQEYLLPRMKLNDIRQGIIDAYKTFLGEEITNEGAYVQYSTLISGLLKLLFKYNKLGISVVGNKSLSKTYPATRFAMMLDKEYYFSQNTEDMTPAGLKGGVGDININGSVSRIFVHGVVTFAGLCVFDEGTQFFTNQAMNNHLKSLPQETLQIDKVGAGQTDQNYTPIILSNFSEFSGEYKKMIKDVYMEKLKKDGPVDANEMQTKLLTINYYLPLHQYKDDEKLLQSIAYVREYYEKSLIDWKTGGRVESLNRLLFDVVVDNEEEFATDGNDANLRIGYTALNPPHPKYLPIVEFIDEILKKFRKRNINLFDENDNTPEVKQQIEKLKKSITKWFQTDGNDVFRYFANGRVAIDSKLNNLIYKTIIGLNLIEHPDANNIGTNVKDFARIHLMKCKRGMSKKEYDYDLHITKFPKVDTGLSQTDIDLHEGAEERRIKEAERRLKEKDSKDTVEDYMETVNAIKEEDKEKQKIDDFISKNVK